MSDERPYVLSIAGFDPSAGAGVLADVKVMEQCEVYGMGVVSALTLQNDSEFKMVEWRSIEDMLEEIKILQTHFEFQYVKIGLIDSLETLWQLISFFKTPISELPTPNSQPPAPKFIWDPILKASAGFEFYFPSDKELLEKICKNIYLITPNVPEAIELGTQKDAQKNAEYLSQFCNVYLKGGHDKKQPGVDVLYSKEGGKLVFDGRLKGVYEKHGSGCVLSSAITANLAKGMNLNASCTEAKGYVIDFLSSNKGLLGYHSKKKAEHE